MTFHPKTQHATTLLRLKQITRHQTMDHRGQSVALLPYIRGDVFDRCMIAEGERPSKRERRKSMHHGPHQLILPILQKKTLQAIRSSELLLVEQQA